MSGQARSASPSSADGRPLLSQSAATTHVRTSAEEPLDRPFGPASDVPNVESAPVVKPLIRSLAPSDVVEPLHSLSLQDDQLSQSGWPAMPAPLPTQSSEATEAVLQEESLVQSPRKPAPDQHTSNPKDLVPEAGEDSLLLRPAYEPSPSPSPGLEGRASPQVNRLEEDSPHPAPPPIEKESPLIWDHEPSVEKEQRSTRTDEADRGEFPDHKEQPSAVRERHASANDHVLVENGLPPIPLESSGLPHDVSQKARQGCAPNHRRPVANPPPAHLEHVHSDTRAPEVPFDFNKFLEQMKLRSAVPVGEYVRSFIRNFARRPHTRASQVQLVMDFLKFITDLMARTAPWSEQSPSEFDNAKEAMEKLVMSRLYNYTFSPAVSAAGKWPIQTDDLERDAVLDQKVALFAWVEEKHLDLPPVGASGGFLEFAIKELLKINHYKAPRDKLICILNVCKVIFGLIRQLKEDASADTFLPLLVLVVLRAKCPHLVSNVEYIAHFRSSDRLNSEAGYYLTSLEGAITFIEQLDFASFSNITHEEFEQNVEQAAVHMAAEAERKRPQLKDQQYGLLEIAGSGVQTLKDVLSGPGQSRPPLVGPSKATASAAEPPSRPEDSREGTDAHGVSTTGFGALTAPLASASLAEDTRQFFQRTGEAAKMGIGRPIGALNKLWSDATSTDPPPVPGPGPKPGAEGAEKLSRVARGEDVLPPMPSPSTSTPPAQRNRLLALFSEGPTASEPASPGGESSFQGDLSGQANSLKLPLPVRGQADVPNPWASGQQEQAKLETLEIMFPNVEGDVCRLMLDACHGNLEDTIDKLLVMG